MRPRPLVTLVWTFAAVIATSQRPCPRAAGLGRWTRGLLPSFGVVRALFATLTMRALLPLRPVEGPALSPGPPHLLPFLDHSFGGHGERRVGYSGSFRLLVGRFCGCIRSRLGSTVWRVLAATTTAPLDGADAAEAPEAAPTCRRNEAARPKPSAFRTCQARRRSSRGSTSCRRRLEPAIASGALRRRARIGGVEPPGQQRADKSASRSGMSTGPRAVAHENRDTVETSSPAVGLPAK